MLILKQINLAQKGAFCFQNYTMTGFVFFFFFSSNSLNFQFIKSKKDISAKMKINFSVCI